MIGRTDVVGFTRIGSEAGEVLGEEGQGLRNGPDTVGRDPPLDDREAVGRQHLGQGGTRPVFPGPATHRVGDREDLRLERHES